jgi:hypothetical protein
MFHERDTDHQTRNCPIFLESKKKMTQRYSQPSTIITAKEVNHTSHWHQPSQSSSSNKPSHQNFSSRIPIKLSKITFAILPAIQLHPTYKPSPYTPFNNHLPFGTHANNISYSKLSNNPTKNRASHQLPNLRNHTHHHRRLQPKF